MDEAKTRALVRRAVSRREFLRLGGVGLAGAALLGAAGCGSAGGGGGNGGDGGETRTFKLAYDQPADSPYGVAGDIFNKKLEELSNGSMSIEQIPGAQLGTEPETLQAVRAGDIDFVLVSTANSSTIAPQAGAFSLQYLFLSKEQAIEALGDPEVNRVFREMSEESVKGARVITLATQGIRNMYSKNEIRSVADIEGKKVRIQATKTEEKTFGAYGAQSVSMPFGEVYTSLQTGAIDVAENSASIYNINKHYEVAPVLSITEHEANHSAIWVSDRVWDDLSEKERGWVEEAAKEVRTTQPERAFELDEEAKAELQELGVQLVEDVDKDSFIEIAEPLQDELAKELGPYAEKLVELVRGFK